MSLRLTQHNTSFTRYSLLNAIKFNFHVLILAYLLLNLLLVVVRATPEVYPNKDLPPVASEADSANEDYRVMVRKRAAPHQYSFGLGKKSYNDLIDSNYLDGYYDNYDDIQEHKRKADPNRFAFGLGKKSMPNERFAFGLGKRANSARFQFGLGKRAVKDNRFSFGLGKREFEEYIKRRYSFGLGKREANDDML